MPIPSYETIMYPFLKFLHDRKERSLSEIEDHLYGFFKMTKAEKRKLLPSGKQPIFRNRIGWAKTYLKKAGLVESPKRAYFKITQRGLDILKENPSEINDKYLERFPEFLEFTGIKKQDEKGDKGQKTLDYSLDPKELLENAYNKLKDELANELLGEVKKAPPDFFENLVIELLVRMGYGGSREDAGQAIGQSGDEGIDGIIKEDKLGLDAIYVQAKRWDKGTIGRPEIHKFVGALKGQGANKGIFITTSTFSSEATEYASKIDSPKIVLIDGSRLAELMFEHDVGVTKEEVYRVKKIDHDYFSES